MKIKLLITIFSLICLLGISLFIFNIFNDRSTLFVFNNLKISKEYIEQYKLVLKNVDEIDSLFSTTAAYELIKNKILIDLCNKENIDISDSTIEMHIKEITDEGSISPLIDNLSKHFNKKTLKEFFWKPFIVENLLIDFIITDTLNIQKERYIEARSILSKWKAPDLDNNLLSKVTDYFEKSLSKEETALYIKENKINSVSFSEDGSFYYITKLTDNSLTGYRTLKVSFEDYLKNLKIKFKLKFKDKSYERAFFLLSEGTIYRELIIIE